MDGEPCWLDAEEMRAWRAYVVGKAVLDAQLNRDLQECHQLALGDYELLVRLSEAPCGQARMSTLADQVASSKSRIFVPRGGLPAVPGAARRSSGVATVA